MNDRQTKDLLAALQESFERDHIPCRKCGGDRLRADFTTSPRCHAPFSYQMKEGKG